MVTVYRKAVLQQCLKPHHLQIQIVIAVHFIGQSLVKFNTVCVCASFKRHSERAAYCFSFIAGYKLFHVIVK